MKIDLKIIGLLFVLLVFSLLSCSKARYQQVIQGSIKIDYPKSIEKDSEFVARMYSLSPERKIVNALVDCQDLTQIDPLTFKVNDCNKELLILGDTVFLAFQVKESGEFVFGNINVITTDLQNENIQIEDIVIDYRVEN